MSISIVSLASAWIHSPAASTDCMWCTAKCISLFNAKQFIKEKPTHTKIDPLINIHDRIRLHHRGCLSWFNFKRYDMLVAMLTCLCPPELLNLLNIMRTVELSDSLNRVQRSSWAAEQRISKVLADTRLWPLGNTNQQPASRPNQTARLMTDCL